MIGQELYRAEAPQQSGYRTPASLQGEEELLGWAKLYDHA